MPRPKISAEVKKKREFFRFDQGGKKRGNSYWTEFRLNLLADEMMDWFEQNHTKVTFAAFCWDHKIPPSYITTFAKRNKYFDYCVQCVKALMESRLVEMGLSGEVDKAVSIFSLKNIAGWSDKKEINSTLEINSRVIELKLPAKKGKAIEAEYKVVETKKRVKSD